MNGVNGWIILVVIHVVVKVSDHGFESVSNAQQMTLDRLASLNQDHIPTIADQNLMSKMESHAIELIARNGQRLVAGRNAQQIVMEELEQDLDHAQQVF